MTKTPYDPSEQIKDLAAAYGGTVTDHARIRGIVHWDIRIEPSRNPRGLRMTTVTMRYQATQIIAVFPERAGIQFAAEAGNLIRHTSFE